MVENYKNIKLIGNSIIVYHQHKIRVNELLTIYFL